MCSRNLTVLDLLPKSKKPPIPPMPPHTVVAEMKTWQIGYVTALHSYKGKIWILSQSTVFPVATTYDGGYYDVAIKKSSHGVWMDCAGAPFVIVDDYDLTHLYLPVNGQWNSALDPKKPKKP